MENALCGWMTPSVRRMIEPWIFQVILFEFPLLPLYPNFGALCFPNGNTRGLQSEL